MNDTKVSNDKGGHLCCVQLHVEGIFVHKLELVEWVGLRYDGLDVTCVGGPRSLRGSRLRGLFFFWRRIVGLPRRRGLTAAVGHLCVGVLCASFLS